MEQQVGRFCLSVFDHLERLVKALECHHDDDFFGLGSIASKFQPLPLHRIRDFRTDFGCVVSVEKELWTMEMFLPRS